MNTREIIEQYFAALPNGDWTSFIADDMSFTNLDHTTHNKESYLEEAGRFFKLTSAVEIKQMVVEGNTAAVLARYTVHSPKGSTGVCDVAEFLTVQGDKLTSSAIYFDTKALAEFMMRD